MLAGVGDVVKWRGKNSSERNALKRPRKNRYLKKLNGREGETEKAKKKEKKTASANKK